MQKQREKNSRATVKSLETVKNPYEQKYEIGKKSNNTVKVDRIIYNYLQEVVIF